MTAEEIRKMQWSHHRWEQENLFAVLREIAAQIAELRALLGEIGPAPAPHSDQSN